MRDGHRWNLETHEPCKEYRIHNGLQCTGSEVVRRYIETLKLGNMEEVKEDTGGECGKLV